MKLASILLAGLLVLPSLTADAAVDAATEKKIDDLLGRMTLEEKI